MAFIAEAPERKASTVVVVALAPSNIIIYANAIEHLEVAGKLSE